MRNLILIALVIMLLVAAGALLLANRSQPAWSCASEEALAEFEKGLAARQKLYYDEARAHFAKTHELAPDFLMGIVTHADHVEEEEREELLARLAAADLSSLSARERFLIERRLAMIDDDQERMEKNLVEFRRQYPDDPYGLAMVAGASWEAGRWDEAEGYYGRLIEVDPNRVTAQNALGYIAMFRGRFDEAEELFRTYNFIAPDQANPHDSLGELLTLVGRYDEAQEELERALAAKPDFCPSYYHLFDVAMLEHDLAGMKAIAARAEEFCDEETVDRLRCREAVWEAAIGGDTGAEWNEDVAECLHRSGETTLLGHRLAVISGHLDEALAIEEKQRKLIAKNAEVEKRSDAPGEASLLHMTALRTAAAGDLRAAAELFRQADEALPFWGGDGVGLMKLYNRIHLAQAYEQTGEVAAALAVIEKLETVNPRFIESFSGLRLPDALVGVSDTRVAAGTADAS